MNLVITVGYLRPKGGWTKAKAAKVHMSLENDGTLMGFWYAEYRLPRDLAGFEPVTIWFQDRFKMPRELGGEGGGFEWKITVLDSGLPLPLLKQE